MPNFLISSYHSVSLLLVAAKPETNYLKSNTGNSNYYLHIFTPKFEVHHRTDFQASEITTITLSFSCKQFTFHKYALKSIATHLFLRRIICYYVTYLS